MGINNTSLEFDIRLSSFDQKNEVDHNVRKSLYHPLPSKGYNPVFGNLPEVPLYKGFSVSCMNKLSKDPLPYRFKSTESPLLFAYLITGQRSFSFENSSEKITTSSGQWYIGYIPEKAGSGIIMGKPRLCSVKFRMDPLALYNLLDGEVNNLPLKIRNLLEKLEGSQLALTGSMTPAMKAAALNLISCPGDPGFSSLAFESGVLDLITLHLKELRFAGDKELHDIKKRIAHEVRDILLESLTQPPTIAQLSKVYKTTPFKLKSIFFKTFGLSISEFIKINRMETARIFLESGNYNVNEAAAETGYLNTGRFISGFKNFYGVKPGDYMRQARKIYCLN